MVGRVESLQDLVLRRAKEIGSNNGPLSIREIARRSDGKVSYTLVQKIANGEYANKAPGYQVLLGLSEALDVPLRQVERTAGAPPSHGPFDLGEDGALLGPAQRAAIRQLVAVMVATSAPQTEEPVAEPAPLRQVARKRPPRRT